MTIPDGHDPWDYVRQYVPVAIAELRVEIDGRLAGITDLMEKRYREGERQYRGDWLTRPPDWFYAQEAEELADWLTYRAMRHVIEDAV